MKIVGVECQFRTDGQLTIQRVQWQGKWQSVEQGRQWSDHEGRHVLVILPGQSAQELVLGKETLNWVLRPLGQKVYLA
ncbi:MAG: hypothetical protein KA314_00140 [Chloroflexi bacterium]|nr:hypothetical protein [Chloroflexota bacterium]MBP8054216.1 hypothetical protein [Chloroflexota bacterium]